MTTQKNLVIIDFNIGDFINDCIMRLAVPMHVVKNDLLIDIKQLDNKFYCENVNDSNISCIANDFEKREILKISRLTSTPFSEDFESFNDSIIDIDDYNKWSKYKQEIGSLDELPDINDTENVIHVTTGFSFNDC